MHMQKMNEFIFIFKIFEILLSNPSWYIYVFSDRNNFIFRLLNNAYII